jgi:hypothetical protein
MAAAQPGTPERLVELTQQVVAQTPGARWVETEDGRGGTIPSPWVPYGPGFEIPLVFTYEGDNPFDWTMLIVVIGGRPRCVQLTCSTIDPARTVTPEGLHRLPLGRLVQEATLMASRPNDEVPHRAIRWRDMKEVRAARAAVVRQHRARARPRRSLTDALLQEVAAVYRENVATGKPSRAVAEHFHYSDASARRVVREARLQGLLGPALPGQGGEQLTGEENNA